MIGCPREDEIAAATARGEWTAELRRHAEQCAVCAEVHTLALLFTESRREILPERAPASAVWRRALAEALLAEELERQARCVRPWVRVQRLAAAAGVLLGGAAGAAILPLLSGAAATAVPAAFAVGAATAAVLGFVHGQLRQAGAR